ncbi:Hypothetical protein D9617_18g034660 [Elsinoe fawcettii]|nr:Hypothetical protein D9617_18g034660 [Elsinoe fawcettii]
MHVSFVAALCALTATASAFRDTSPFIVLSTSSKSLLKSARILDSESLKSSLSSGSLQTSSAKNIIIASLSSVDSSDFTPDSAPYIAKILAGKTSGASGSAVNDVVGTLSSQDLETIAQHACSGCKTSRIANGALPSSGSDQLVTVDLGAVSGASSDRVQSMRRADAYLNEVLKGVDGTWTVLLRTTPRVQQDSSEVKKGKTGLVNQEGRLYDMDADVPYPGHAKAEHWKRSMEAYPRQDGGKRNATVGLFEKYTFFSDGIFMGVTISILLLSILYVGLSAVSGLEVSYMAFSKEMNPTTQKKQQ